MTLILIMVIVALIAILGGIYNSLVRGKTNIEESWAQIDVQLKRRYDLIPNLVDTAKAYAKHEQDTLERVIEARNNLVASPNASKEDIMTQNNVIEQGLKSIFALTESYPELQSNKNYMIVQEELISTENKVAYSRQLYNTCVSGFNAKVKSFPTVFVAGMFGFGPEKLLEALDEERKVIKVDF